MFFFIFNASSHSGGNLYQTVFNTIPLNKGEIKGDLLVISTPLSRYSACPIGRRKADKGDGKQEDGAGES
jgi:hypothetical protein